MKNGLLTCIVLTYRNGEFLFETIDSILMQDYPHIELIVAEDGASDFNAETIKKYIEKNKKENLENFVIHSNSPNLGTVKNVNKALRTSRGEYVKIIAGDDAYPDSNTFSRQVAYLQDNEGLFVAGDTVSCDDKMNERYRVGFSYCKKNPLQGSRKALYRYLVLKELGLLATQVCCFRREFFEQLGYYDERYILLEDMPMEKRIVLSNTRINYFQHPAVMHRGDVGTSTSSEAFDSRKYKYYLDLFHEAENNYVVDSGVLGAFPAYMRKRLCKYRLDMCKLNERENSKKQKIVLTLKNVFPLLWHISKHKKSLTTYGKSFLSTLSGRK